MTLKSSVMWFVLFGVTALIGLMMLNVATVVGLASIMGSIVWALVVVALLNIGISALIYALKLHTSLMSLSRQIATIYEASSMLEQLFGRAITLIKKIWAD